MKGNNNTFNLAPTNTLAGLGNNTFFRKKPKEPNDDTKVIDYRLAFVERFNNVSQLDISLQKKYALNLISKHVNVKEEFLTLKQRYKIDSILHTDRVYYVHRGKKLIGKCSIREQRTFTKTDLIFIFRTRHRVSKNKKKAVN